MVSVFPLSIVSRFWKTGTCEVELLLKMPIVALPVTVIGEVADPKVVFHVPIASVPATRIVPPV